MIDDIPYESSPLAKLDWKQTRNRMRDKMEWELSINDKMFYGTDKKLTNGGFLTTLFDITPNKKAEEKQRLLFEAINEIPVVIDLWDETDKLVFANDFSQNFHEKHQKSTLFWAAGNHDLSMVWTNRANT